MVLQQVAEEITEFNEDLGPQERRNLLSALMGLLDPILPFLCATIRTNLAAATAAAQRGDGQAASAHGNAVMAACGMSLFVIFRSTSVAALFPDQDRGDQYLFTPAAL